MKDRRLFNRLDEMYALDRDGAPVVPDTETDCRSEAHVHTDNGELIAATRGKKRPHANMGKTFRVGPTHSHPISVFGNSEDHSLHLLEAGEPHSMGKSLLRLFRRRASEARIKILPHDQEINYFDE